jgi:hypothetical protein
MAYGATPHSAAGRAIPEVNRTSRVHVWQQLDHAAIRFVPSTPARVFYRSTMEALLADEVIDTDYGQLDLVWSDYGGFDGDVDRFFANQVNGLVGASDPNGVYLSLGRRSGGSHVRIVLLKAEPGDAAEHWEDVVEVSLVIPVGREVRWMSWAGETSGRLDMPAGSYRLRVSARGRDVGAADELADDVVDHYLLELWSASPEEDRILRVGTDNARYWHAEWGGRR